MEQVDDLLLQVRTAHRLLAAYYQRIVPAIGDMASMLELDFYYWGNADFNSVPSGQYNVTTYDPWRLLPAMNTSYLYYKLADKDKNKIDVGDYFVEFAVISDTGVDSHGDGHSNELDALELTPNVDNALSLLRVTICAPYKLFDYNLYNTVWAATAYPEFSLEPNPQKDENEVECFVCGFECSLGELMQKNGVEQVVERIQQHISSTVAAAEAEHERVAGGQGVAS